MTSLKGRVAIVTGSARNIGRAIAGMLAREGAAVMIHARSDAEGVEETRAMIEADGGRAGSHLADLSTEEGARDLVAQTLAQLGPPTIAVNNAAIRRNTPFTQLSLAEWHEVLANSLDCAFLVSRESVPHMVAAKWGRIVNITGITAHKGTPGRAHVGAAKAGMMGMTRSLATEFAKDGITVNCISPGIIATVRGGAAGQRPSASANAEIPMGRDGTVEEIAHMVTMLCRPEAAYTTGQVIEVNGGLHF